MDDETRVTEIAAIKPEEKNARTTRKKSVEAEQKRYSSVREFCDYYGLRYTSVQYYLRQGKTGDEILKTLQQHPINRKYSKAPGRAVSVKIGDDVFKSISEAAMAYGVSDNQIEAAMENGVVSLADVDKMITKNSESPSWHAKECVVAGIQYPSMAAAARAYGIPMVTVRSRMAREGISFEEALRRGHAERRRIKPERTKWRRVNLEPIENDMEFGKTSMEIFSLMEQNNYHPKLFRDSETKVFAIQIQESLDALSRPLDVFIFYDGINTARDIEFVIPKVGKQRILSNTKQVLLYQKINEVNEKYIGSKVFLYDRIFSASWSITQVARSIQATAFMRCFYRFIGSTAGIWEELKWAEQEWIPE